MSIYDPYKDPNRVPTSLDTAHLTRSVRDFADSRRGNASGGATITSSGEQTTSGDLHTSGQTTQTSVSGGPGGQATDDRIGPRTQTANRSAILTVFASIVSWSIFPLTFVLGGLAGINELVCDEGMGTAACGGANQPQAAMALIFGVGLVAFIISTIGGGRIKRGRNLAGPVLVIIAIGVMTFLVSHLRETLLLPFPFG